MLVPDLLNVSLYAFNFLSLLDQLLFFGLEHWNHLKADLDLVFFREAKTVSLNCFLFKLFQRWKPS
jgi:hypothetical protein